MKKIEKGNLVSLSASEDMSLCPDGKIPAKRIGQTTVVKADVDRWSEIPRQQVDDAAVARERERAYKELVEALIAERYSPSDETSLINNMLDESPTEEHVAEYRTYQAYRAECKARVREELFVEQWPAPGDTADAAAIDPAIAAE